MEVVDDRGAPVPPGLPGSKVLLTNLVNRAQPLIRYELADSVVLAAGPDPSGRPYDRIQRVDGRSDDVLSLPTADGGFVSVHPYLVRAPFTLLPEVVQYQIVHRQRRPARQGGAPAAIRLRPGGAGRDCHAHAVAGAGARIDVSVVAVDRIEREPGHAAKVKLVVSEVPATG